MNQSLQLLLDKESDFVGKERASRNAVLNDIKVEVHQVHKILIVKELKFQTLVIRYLWRAKIQKGFTNRARFEKRNLIKMLKGGK